MAAVVGAVAGAVKTAVGAVTDAVDLPEGKWQDCGPVCDMPCMISGLCGCSCISVYMTWAKIMTDEAMAKALFVVLGNCLGIVIAVVLTILGSVIQFPLLAVVGTPCPALGQCLMLVKQRKELGTWMNIPEDKLATPQDMVCHFCCCCFMLSAEQRSVDDWMANTMLIQAPLKAAHDAKKALNAASAAVTGP